MIEAMLAGALIFFAGMAAGRMWPSRRKGPKPGKPPQPVCGCRHHYSYHDAKTGACHGRIYEGSGYPYSDCTCRRYSGPEPLPEFYAPEITP